MSTLSLYRNPKFSDTITTNFRQLTRRNMENQLQTFKSAYWATTDTFKFEVDALSKTQADTIISFLRANAGQEITLIDYNGVVWTGIMIDNPQTEQTGVGCQYKISMTLEGSFVVP